MAAPALGPVIGRRCRASVPTTAGECGRLLVTMKFGGKMSALGTGNLAMDARSWVDNCKCLVEKREKEKME